MGLPVKYCMYYDKRTHEIIDFLPKSIPQNIRNNIIVAWENPIMRKILIGLSENNESSASSLKEVIGHSASTIHENLARLEELGLIETKMIYKGKKQKILSSKVLCVTKNPKLKRIIKEALNQGLWVDTKKTRQILKVLENNPDTYFSAEELSLLTKIPVDEIKVLLDNYDSQITRALTDFLKKSPVEKKVLYKIAK